MIIVMACIGRGKMDDNHLLSTIPTKKYTDSITVRRSL